MNTLLAIHSDQKLPTLGHYTVMSNTPSIIRRRRRTSEVGI
jgi:hypothetical protein